MKELTVLDWTVQA